jgi:putative sigma-54 modulation protein
MEVEQPVRARLRRHHHGGGRAPGELGEASVRTIVKGRNFEVPESLRRHAERKLARLERILDDRSDAVVELSIERHRSQDDSRIVEVTLVIDGQPLRSKAAAISHQAAIDIVIDKLERQTVDHRQKPRHRGRPIEEKHLLSRLADGTADVGRPRRIVKTKRFAIEPMFEEDAIAEMEELGHSFFLFVNAENERLALVYRRSDGDFGLIEPVIGGSYAPAGGRGAAADRDRRARVG